MTSRSRDLKKVDDFLILMMVLGVIDGADSEKMGFEAIICIKIIKYIIVDFLLLFNSKENATFKSLVHLQVYKTE